MGLCRISKNRDLAVSLCDTCGGYLVDCHCVFVSPHVLRLPFHVMYIRSGSCFTLRMGFEGKFDFSIYYRAAQKRDWEPVTPPVLSFPRVEVGPNTTNWKSKQDHFHRHGRQYAVLMPFLCETNPQTHPASWSLGMAGCLAHHTTLWPPAMEVTLLSADQNRASGLPILLFFVSFGGS